MAASVQVLCPNGRRQTVKVTPNTKLLQVLEEVCQRQGFIPTEDYKLIQGKKDLDLSLSFRFSSLSNNAKLELAKSTTARVEQDVTIALQLDSGQRLQDNFSPSITLWDLLLHFEAKHGDHKGQLARVETGQGTEVHPVCIFMREEVIGEPALRATTLKKLALTSGKAIIRLLHRPVEESLIADISDQVEKDRAKQSKLEQIAQKKKEMMDQHEREDLLKESMKKKLHQIGEERDDETNGSGEQQPQAQPPHQTNQRRSGDEAMDVDQTQPEEDTISSTSFSGDSTRHRTGRTVSTTPTVVQPPSHSQDPIDQLRDMNIPGVQIFTPDDFNDLNPTEQAIARRLAQRFMPHLQPAATNPQENAMIDQQQAGHSSHQDEQSANAFINFKFPEETKGKDLIGSESRQSIHFNDSPCDRSSIVYTADEPLPISSKDVPESFFEVTQADVRIMYKDLQSAVQKLDDQPLMTKSLRHAQAESAFDHYERVVIRIHFPDKMVLQACFRPRETVGTLHAFVKDSLQDNRLKFYLYTTPPKVVLKDMKSTLALSQLAPAALVYFGCQEDRDHFIRDDLLCNTKSRLEAETNVAEILDSSPSDSQLYQEGASTSSQSKAGPSGASSNRAPNFSSHPASSSSRSSTPSGVLPSGTQVPKWLKLGKK